MALASSETAKLEASLENRIVQTSSIVLSAHSIFWITQDRCGVAVKDISEFSRNAQLLFSFRSTGKDSDNPVETVEVLSADGLFDFCNFPVLKEGFWPDQLPEKEFYDLESEELAIEVNFLSHCETFFGFAAKELGDGVVTVKWEFAGKETAVIRNVGELYISVWNLCKAVFSHRWQTGKAAHERATLENRDLDFKNPWLWICILTAAAGLKLTKSIIEIKVARWPDPSS